MQPVSNEFASVLSAAELGVIRELNVNEATGVAFHSTSHLHNIWNTRAKVNSHRLGVIHNTQFAYQLQRIGSSK